MYAQGNGVDSPRLHLRIVTGYFILGLCEIGMAPIPLASGKESEKLAKRKSDCKASKIVIRYILPFESVTFPHSAASFKILGLWFFPLSYLR